MNTTIIKFQLLFFTFLLISLTTLVGGISFSRSLVSDYKTSLTPSQLVRPIEQFYAYRLALARKNNQTILQTIIDPKKEELINKNEAVSIPVLLYHGIVDTPDGNNITLDSFKDQMFTLKKAGYETVTLEDYILFIQGKKQLPEKSFLLTFDDGRKDSYYPLDPILKALNYKATMFVISKHVVTEKNSNYYLSKSELLTMQKSGRWNIESHGKEAHDEVEIDQYGTKGHFYSNKLWLKEQQRLETTEEFTIRVTKDMADAKTELEAAGFPITTIAFPFGDYGQYPVNFPEAADIVPFIARDLYQVSFYQLAKSTGNNYLTQNYFGSELAFSKRITVTPETNGLALVSLLESGNAKDLPFSDRFTNPNQWLTQWGESAVENNSITIGSKENSSGGSAFLVGSNHWKNYRADASVQWQAGDTFNFLVRVKDSQNYISCDFSSAQVQISMKVNGELLSIAKSKLKESLDPSGAKLSVGVYGNKVSCYVNDKEVLSSDKLDPSFIQGGVGFATWDKEVGNSAITIQSLYVTALNPQEQDIID